MFFPDTKLYSNKLGRRTSQASERASPVVERQLPGVGGRQGPADHGVSLPGDGLQLSGHHRAAGRLHAALDGHRHRLLEG